MANKTYRSIFTGKEIDEAIIYLRNNKNRDTIQFIDVPADTTKVLFSFDYTKYNYMSVIVSAENSAGQLFITEFKALSTKTGTTSSEVISTMGTTTDLFDMSSNTTDGKCNITVTASVLLKSIKAEITNLI